MIQICPNEQHEVVIGVEVPKRELLAFVQVIVPAGPALSCGCKNAQ